ncbi:conserved Plasmodium protein, unknown function [Plasmodium ovale curtisi]|uniref:Uncharacterized protein n=1 Tax=Plasmodium ovale curtisi TaxID=864141 RepID=A0A1A8WXB2_PLAOA|nr:conserved Plasmodium protein, unknown function [Plasmodium ovale curtisi]
MNERLHYTAAFYVLNVDSWEGNPASFWKNWAYMFTEDIVVIGLRNVFDEKLANAVRKQVERYANRKENYKTLNFNYDVEKDTLLVMIKGGLHNDVHDVYHKTVKICTRKKYGREYKKVMWYLFDEFFRGISEEGKKICPTDTSTTPPYESTICQNTLLLKVNGLTYHNELSTHFSIDIEKRKIKEFRLSRGQEEGPVEVPCSTGTRRRQKMLRTCSDNSPFRRNFLFMKNESKEEDVRRREKYDHNCLTCVMFAIKDVCLCVGICSTDLRQRLEREDYYKYTLRNYGVNRVRANCTEKKRFQGNRLQDNHVEGSREYMRHYVESYHLCVKQLCNYFLDGMLFETKKEDLHLFSADVVILLGVENNVACNYKERDPEGNSEGDDSFFVDRNVLILSKSKDHVLQKRSYATLTANWGRSKSEWFSPGFKVTCDLFTQRKVEIIDEFFYTHFDGVEEKWKSKDMSISINPGVIDLGPLRTYQIYQANFELSYEDARGSLRSNTERGDKSGCTHGGINHLCEVDRLRGCSSPHFSVLCLDGRSRCPIPVNVYSYLHLRKNTIFKYMEENVLCKGRYAKRTMRGCSRNYRENGQDKTQNFDALRYIYVYPYKGILARNKKQVMKLTFYAEHVLCSDITKGTFFLIIRMHNLGKDLFMTFNYSLRNSVIYMLMGEEERKDDVAEKKGNGGGLISGQVSKLTWGKSYLGKGRGSTPLNANLSVHKKAKRFLFTQQRKVGTKAATKTAAGGTPENGKMNQFSCTNFTKLFLYMFFTVDKYHTLLRSGKVEDEVSDVFSFLRHSHISNYNLMHLIDPIYENTKKGHMKESKGMSQVTDHMSISRDMHHFNYPWKKHYFYVKYGKQDGLLNETNNKSRFSCTWTYTDNIYNIPKDISYLTKKIKKSEQIQRKISKFLV